MYFYFITQGLPRITQEVFPPFLTLLIFTTSDMSGLIYAEQHFERGRGRFGSKLGPFKVFFFFLLFEEYV